RALNVHTADLLRPAPGIHLEDHDAEDLTFLGIRQALTPALGASVTITETPDLNDLNRQAAAIRRKYYDGDSSAVVRDVPLLIHPAQAATERYQGRDRELALEVLAIAYEQAGTALVQLQREDHGCHALTLAIATARASGNQLLTADCVYWTSWAFIRQKR